MSHSLPFVSLRSALVRLNQDTNEDFRLLGENCVFVKLNIVKLKKIANKSHNVFIAFLRCIIFFYNVVKLFRNKTDGLEVYSGNI